MKKFFKPSIQAADLLRWTSYPKALVVSRWNVNDTFLHSSSSEYFLHCIREREHSFPWDKYIPLYTFELDAERDESVWMTFLLLQNMFTGAIGGCHILAASPSEGSYRYSKYSLDTIGRTERTDILSLERYIRYYHTQGHTIPLVGVRYELELVNKSHNYLEKRHHLKW